MQRRLETDRSRNPNVQTPWQRYRALIEAMIQTDIVGSLSLNRGSEMLPAYRTLLARMDSLVPPDQMISMLEVMGCDNLTVSWPVHRRDSALMAASRYSRNDCPLRMARWGRSRWHFVTENTREARESDRDTTQHEILAQRLPDRSHRFDRGSRGGLLFSAQRESNDTNDGGSLLPRCESLPLHRYQRTISKRSVSPTSPLDCKLTLSTGDSGSC